MTAIALSATGLYLPAPEISNEELAAAFNAYAAAFNAEHADAIEAGHAQAISPSSSDYIERASGIKARRVIERAGVLDPAWMRPTLPERPNTVLSVMAEFGLAAARQALERAGRTGADVDAVICAASNLQRPYPAIANEIQHALDIEGFAFDMNAACSSATFALLTAADFVRAGHARSVLIVTPEIVSGHLNWRDRQSHFLFGDAAVAMLVERADFAPPGAWAILGAKAMTKYSNAIRNNFGFLNRCAPEAAAGPDKLLVQDGRKAFKEIELMVSDLILAHMAELKLKPADLKRLWLYQAGQGVNRRVAQRVLGHEASAEESPIVLDRYANTSSAGPIIAFHEHNADFQTGDKGLICSFGAGYSAGTVFLQKAG